MAASTNLMLFLIFLIGLSSIVRFFGLSILEIPITFLLETFNPGVERQSKAISGPRWRVPNGSVLERFIDGRANSQRWQSYGSVYRLWCGPHPEIVITTVEDLKHFSSDSEDHGKPLNTNMGWFVGEVMGKCMGLLKGEDYKRLRKIFEPPFTHSAAISRIHLTEEATRKYVEDLPSMAEVKKAGVSFEADNSFALPVIKVVNKFPYFLTAKAIYGPMTKEEELNLWTVTEKRLALNPYLFIGGPYRFETGAKWFDYKSIAKLREFQKEWREYNANLVETRRARGDRSLIMTLWEEYESGNMSLDELIHTLDELLMLNLDVFTHVLTWYITLIADHGAIKRELQDEIKANGNDMNAYLARTDSHLHRCFLESVRVRPFTSFTIGEYSHHPKNYGGVMVKPGTQTIVDILAINIRNPFWGADSEIFKPSRFKTIKQADLRYNLHVFGFGSRKCMGQYVAGHIAKALIAHLFSRYDITVSDGNKLEDDYEIDRSSWTPKADTLLRLTELEQ